MFESYAENALKPESRKTVQKDQKPIFYTYNILSMEMSLL